MAPPGELRNIIVVVGKRTLVSARIDTTPGAETTVIDDRPGPSPLYTPPAPGPDTADHPRSTWVGRTLRAVFGVHSGGRAGRWSSSPPPGRARHARAP